VSRVPTTASQVPEPATNGAPVPRPRPQYTASPVSCPDGTSVAHCSHSVSACYHWPAAPSVCIMVPGAISICRPGACLFIHSTPLSLLLAWCAENMQRHVTLPPNLVSCCELLGVSRFIAPLMCKLRQEPASLRARLAGRWVPIEQPPVQDPCGVALRRKVLALFRFRSTDSTISRSGEMCREVWDGTARAAAAAAVAAAGQASKG